MEVHALPLDALAPIAFQLQLSRPHGCLALVQHAVRCSLQQLQPERDDVVQGSFHFSPYGRARFRVAKSFCASVSTGEIRVKIQIPQLYIGAAYFLFIGLADLEFRVNFIYDLRRILPPLLYSRESINVLIFVRLDVVAFEKAEKADLRAVVRGRYVLQLVARQSEVLILHGR